MSAQYIRTPSTHRWAVAEANGRRCHRWHQSVLENIASIAHKLQDTGADGLPFLKNRSCFPGSFRRRQFPLHRSYRLDPLDQAPPQPQDQRDLFCRVQPGDRTVVGSKIGRVRLQPCRQSEKAKARSLFHLNGPRVALQFQKAVAKLTLRDNNFDEEI
ncbi:hypothetical protein Q31b_19580 [Novipirellula aureliae]|uniref:Uncharacterized protein n=1 Tax=Novipirellula aureliae TaxID=2527966 RepID=A0A5C6E667_9BACT|nr:hypothetical protein Q31b_19580 [Novipirellula aureliae]